MGKKAFLVGINYYGSPQQLKGCVNDVQNMARFLIDYAGYPAQNVYLLTDEPPKATREMDVAERGGGKDKEKNKDKDKGKEKGKEKDKEKDKGKDKGKEKEKGKDKGKEKEKDKDKGKDKDKDKVSHQMQGMKISNAPGGGSDKNPIQVYGQLPTRANILAGIDWLMQGVSSGDQIFFQFSGHGGQTADTSGDEDDGLDETLIPLDFKTSGVIIDDLLHEKLVKALPSGANLFCVMDCCHSGTGLDLPFRVITTDDKPTKEERKRMKEEGKKKKNAKAKDKKGRGHGDSTQACCVLISGCLDNQTSADLSMAGNATGALSYALVSVLKKSNMKLTYEELLYGIRDTLKSMPTKLGQLPQLSYNLESFEVDRQIVI